MVGGGMVRMAWRGKQSADEAALALARAQVVELELSPDLHHALFGKLCPAASAGAAGRIDMSGGPELLRSAAEIRSLEPLAALAEAVSEFGAEVRLISPPPRFVIQPREDGSG